MKWTSWVLDVTIEPPCFCPYDADSGAVVTGMMLFQETCPGRFAGVFHDGGREKAQAWVEAHPEVFARVLAGGSPYDSQRN
jgi:hypothetical protein